MTSSIFRIEKERAMDNNYVKFTRKLLKIFINESSIQDNGGFLPTSYRKPSTPARPETYKVLDNYSIQKCPISSFVIIHC